MSMLSHVWKKYTFFETTQWKSGGFNYAVKCDTFVCITPHGMTNRPPGSVIKHCSAFKVKPS